MEKTGETVKKHLDKVTGNFLTLRGWDKRRVLVAIKAGLSDNDLSYNSVKIIQKSCLLIAAMAPNRDHF